MSDEYLKPFIGGDFVVPDGDLAFKSINPATRECNALVAISNEVDVDLAVHAARTAFDKGPWPRMHSKERAGFLRRIADLIDANKETLAQAECEDNGMLYKYILGGQVPRASAIFRHYAEETCRRVGETYPFERNYYNLVHREPIGVAALITPWNSPLGVAAFNIAAALCAGNTCVVKPSEHAPVSASILAEIIQQADLPLGVFNMVQGPGQPTGEALVRHPGIDLISFTGGTETGKKILQTAARDLKRVALELGGKSANIIFADADLERALDSTLILSFGSNGEACFSGSRILIQKPVYEQFKAMLTVRAKNIRIGDPFDNATEMGPLISAEHRQSVQGFVDRAQQQRAKLLTGGMPLDGRGWFYPPTLLENVSSGMEIAQEEIFGPVSILMPFDTAEEAVAIANDSRYGLAGYVWSGNTERALSVAEELKVGVAAVNSPVIRDIRVPFGGKGHSGLGRVGGRYGLEFFSEPKTTVIPMRPFPFPKLGLSSE